MKAEAVRRELLGDSSKRVWAEVGAVCGVAVALRLVVVWASREAWVFSDMHDYYVRAMHLLDHGAYVPDAFRAPGYPTLLATVFSVAGENVVAARLAQIGLAVAIVLLTYSLGRRLLTHRAALAAAAVVAAYPAWQLYSVYLMAENLFTPLVLLGLWLATRAQDATERDVTGAGSAAWEGRATRDGRATSEGNAAKEDNATRPSAARAAAASSSRASWWSLAAGVALGLATLTRAAGLAAVAGIAALEGWEAVRARRPRRLLRLALLVAAFAVVMAPWTLRNAGMYGRLVLVDTSSGYNFLIGNNPLATGQLRIEDLPELTERYWGTVGSDAERSAVGYREGLAFIASNPGRALLLAVKKVGFLAGLEGREHAWVFSNSYFGSRRAATVWAWGVALLLSFPLLMVPAVVGMARPGLRRSTTGRYVIAVLGAVVLLHVASFGESRFHLPWVPLLAILAARAAPMARRGGAGPKPTAPRPARPKPAAPKPAGPGVPGAESEIVPDGAAADAAGTTPPASHWGRVRLTLTAGSILFLVGFWLYQLPGLWERLRVLAGGAAAPPVLPY